jgi:hypothetical protein
VAPNDKASKFLDPPLSVRVLNMMIGQIFIKLSGFSQGFDAIHLKAFHAKGWKT